jgi:adenylate cyclase
MLQPRHIKYLKSILLSMLGWVVAVTLFGYIRLYGLDGEGLYQLLIPKEYPLWQVILVQGLTMGSALGLVYGFLDSWLDRGVLKKFAYGLVVVFRTLVHLLVFPVMVILAIVVSFYAGGGNPEYLSTIIRQRLFSPSFFLLLTYTGLVSIVFNTFRQMNAMFGPGILYKVMTGRYHQPKEEERIFMFLDLKSSTTYAERLGHMLYSELIQDCFKDLTEAVRKHQAEIYQYVGDEAVLTWTIKAGLEKANCLWAYFLV